MERLRIQKGSSLPINSTAILVLIIMFIALFYAIVSGAVGGEDSGLVGRLLGLSDDYSPEDPSSSSFMDEPGVQAERVSFEGQRIEVRGALT